MPFLLIDITISSSVIIRYFDLVNVAIVPAKTDAALIVDADAVLSGSVAFQLLEAVSRRHCEIIQSGSGIQHR